jgi:uncharacterized protein (DUF362 family)
VTTQTRGGADLAKVKVSIVRFQSPEQSLLRAIKLIGGIDDLDRPRHQVLIKPGIFDPIRSPHANLAVAKAVISLFHKTRDISFAESNNHLRTSLQALKAGGYDQITRVGLVDLSDNLTKIKKTRAKILRDQKFSRILLDADVLVDFPVMKTESSMGGISIGVKNLFGLIPDKIKSSFHPILDDVLLELLKLFKPDLTVVDATTLYLGSYPNQKPFKTGLIVVGRDAVAVDAVCCMMMGINPESVKHLLMATRGRLGTIDPGDIEVVGLRLDEVTPTFRAADSIFRQTKT